MSEKQQQQQAGKDDERVRFSLALVRLLKYFNLLKENVGLSISHLENPAALAIRVHDSFL
jgi:hypothetical protein